MNDQTDVQTQDAPLQSEQVETNQSIDPSDKLTPEHPRFKEVLERAKSAEGKVEELQRQLDEISQRVDQRYQDTGDDELTADEIAWLNRVDRGLKAKGYVTQEELRAERKAMEYEKLSGKYNGSNGLPKFDVAEVEAHAKRNGFSNLEKAYKDLHFDAFVQVEAKRTTPNPPSSERPGGGDRDVRSTEFTPEAIAAMDDITYERNREKILASIKSSAR